MKILLVGFYYPPLQTIASERIASVARYFQQRGHSVHVVARYFDAQQRTGNNMLVGYEESAGITSNYIIENNALYVRYRKTNTYKSLARFLPPGIKGRYLLSKTDAHHYGWVEDSLTAVKEVWGNEKFDLVISSYGPPAAIMLGNELAALFSATHVVEFRDAYIDERDAGWIRKQKIKNQEKLLKPVSGLVFSSQGMQEYFSASFSFAGKTCVVYNGVLATSPGFAAEDQKTVDEFIELKKKYSTVLVHTGTLYGGQDINFFLSVNDPGTVAVFVGLAKNDEIALQQNIPCVFLPRVKRETSIYMQQQATALLFPVWKGRYTGFSGKLLEYLASGTPVVCSPGPQSDLLPFFEASGNVYVCNSHDEWKNSLRKLQSGEIKPKPPVNPSYFSREHWLGKFYDFIHNECK